MAVREAIKEGKRPPGLRKGNARTRCGTCSHFESNYRHGMCRKFNYPVEASQLSDNWKAA